MNSYNINNNTIALIPIKNRCTKVIEENDTFLVNMNPMKIIERSCEFFGSSYLGRHIGTKVLTGIRYKSPIIIEESNNIIYFPTTSPRLLECIWISLNHIDKYIKKEDKSLIYFINGEKLIINISYESFNNQYLRATKLEYIIRKRKL